MEFFAYWSGKASAALAAAVALVLGVWGALVPMVQLLLILMVLDIATGLLAAVWESDPARRLDSKVSFKGMTKKAIALLIVAAAAAVTRADGALVVGDLRVSLDVAVAGFYCIHEGISILENADRAGLPVPKFLKEALSRLSPEQPGEVEEGPEIYG